jgi:hypothetical protein
MPVKNLFPNYLGVSGRDDNRLHAEATEAAQAAWERAEAANERNAREFEARKNVPKREEVRLPGCVFAKPCALPDGVINYNNPGGYVPLDLLKDYGAYAVLGSAGGASATGTALQWVGGSGSASALAARLGGFAMRLVTPSSVAILVGVLIPNTTSADSAFYTAEQYAQLTDGNTRVRLNIKQLPDGSVDFYGFYTGTKPEWQRVPVIAAEPQGDQLVADMGDGIKITWTPAEDPSSVMGIPALEGVTLKPAAWVFPPTDNAAKLLVNPVYPPDYHDAIIWFPSQPQIAPIYLSLNVRPGDHSYHPAPNGLTAFPDAVKDRSKNPVKGGGGLRRRWKDRKGRIYEWDSENGRVELYDKQGKHLGEFDPETGEQTKGPKPGRTTPK